MSAMLGGASRSVAGDVACHRSMGCAAEGAVAINELAELQAAVSAAQTPGHRRYEETHPA